VIASVLVMSAHAADAHGILGHRLFAGTLSFDGRVVADEAVCPNSRAVPERDAVVGSEFAFLKNKSTNDLLSLQQQFERGTKRHGDTQRFAAIVLGERRYETPEGMLAR